MNVSIKILCLFAYVLYYLQSKGREKFFIWTSENVKYQINNLPSKARKSNFLKKQTENQSEASKLGFVWSGGLNPLLTSSEVN